MEYVVYWNEQPTVISGAPACACAQAFPAIDPEAKRVLTFDFSNGLPDGVTIVSATIEVSVVTGTDGSPASHFTTPPVVDGAKVTTVASGCLDGVTYHARIVATTSDSDSILVIGANLPCVES